MAVEVAVTSGGIDKLGAYKRLQISEVWIGQQGKLFLFALRADGYEPIESYALLPEIDCSTKLHQKCLDTGAGIFLSDPRSELETAIALLLPNPNKIRVVGVWQQQQ